MTEYYNDHNNFRFNIISQLNLTGKVALSRVDWGVIDGFSGITTRVVAKFVE